MLQEIVYLVSQGADPDEIGLMNIDEQLPVLEYPQPGLDIIQVRLDSAVLLWMTLSWALQPPIHQPSVVFVSPQELTSPRLIKSHLPYRFLPTALHHGEAKVGVVGRCVGDVKQNSTS